MPLNSKKDKAEKRFKLGEPVAALRVRNILDVASRLRNTVPHVGMVDFRFTGVDSAFDPAKSILHNPYDGKKF